MSERGKFNSVLQIDRGVGLNLENHTLTHGEKSVILTRYETGMLIVLASNKGHIFERETLLRRVWPPDEPLSKENAVWIAVCRLKKKLKELDLDDFLITITGHGYKWDEPENHSP